ncbi:two-component system, OmpR family, response regulator MprA [Palleronia marisminoris]|uniref:Response regulator MprA n=1 Tax=Palleronia marisminoris TaxID=315423 RepID=A0A1Y5RR22_9RHOB|nr:response regulator transcription factor [Palleronia marisminoris]SFG26869.1 two-component system, OmpR family, response regulator MprA [Palleronia marisminoris]SLN20492.1 Response regulator MprA [Palleronia marisminoris]
MSAILIVEDDVEIADFLSFGLSAEGYSVQVERYGASLLDRVRGGAFRLVILDRMLPDAEGIDLCRRLRAAGDGTLVLMLTARDALEEKLEGLRAGADDYMTKPFAFEELLARIEVLLRRASPPAKDRVIRYADLTIDLAQKVARREGRELGLTATEYGLLLYLVENAGRVVSRLEILNAVWGYDFDPNTNIVEVYIAYLRKKVDRDFDGRLIQNVRGFGYQLSHETPQKDRSA